MTFGEIYYTMYVLFLLKTLLLIIFIYHYSNAVKDLAAFLYGKTFSEFDSTIWEDYFLYFGIGVRPQRSESGTRSAGRSRDVIKVKDSPWDVPSSLRHSSIITFIFWRSLSLLFYYTEIYPSSTAIKKAALIFEFRFMLIWDENGLIMSNNLWKERVNMKGFVNRKFMSFSM